jgi:putative ABC transport system substrate-binding protein
MKKIGMCSMSLAFIISLALSNSAFAAGKPLRVAMLLWRGETKAEQGFKNGLKELGYSVEYTIMNAGQDRKKLRHILNDEIAPKLTDLDYIYTFGTTVSNMTKIFIHDRVPQLFNIVFAPVEAGIVRSMEKTGGNISGTTNVVPVSVRIEAALEIMQFRRLGLFFNPREENTMIQRQEVYDVSKKFHFEVVGLRSPLHWTCWCRI